MSLCLLLMHGGLFARCNHDLQHRQAVSKQSAQSCQAVSFCTSDGNAFVEACKLSNIDTDHTRWFFSLRVYELLMHAFRSGDAKLKAIALECMSSWNVKPDKRIKTAMAVMSNAVLWNVMLGVRGAFVAIKRLLSLF